MIHFLEVALQVVVEKENVAAENVEELVKKLVVVEEKQEESERVADADNRFIYNLYIYKWQQTGEVIHRDH